MIHPLGQPLSDFCGLYLRERGLTGGLNSYISFLSYSQVVLFCDPPKQPGSGRAHQFAYEAEQMDELFDLDFLRDGRSFLRG